MIENLDISYRYQPLFDVPKGVDTFVITGGRNSSKSFAVGLASVIKTVQENHRILYTRYTLTSASDSIIPEIQEKISLLNYDDKFHITKNSIISNKNQGKIVFKGIKTSSGNQTANLKSLKNFSMFILEEAEEMPNENDWTKVCESIRSVDVQPIYVLILNPTTKEHWIYNKFFEDKGVPEGFNGVKDNICYIHTTYKDTPTDYIPKLKQEAYKRQEHDYNTYENANELERQFLPNSIVQNWRYYKFVVLGGWLNKAEGVIYENWIVKDFDYSLPYIFGLDFGSNDPDALTRVAINHKTNEIYIKEEYFKNNTSFEALTKILYDRCGYDNLIIADAAERRMIIDLYDIGFNIEKCKKGDKSVQRGIKLIQGYTLCIDSNSINLQKALNNYVWHDKKSGVPNHDWSDLCDSFRYAVVDILNESNTQIQW